MISVLEFILTTKFVLEANKSKRITTNDTKN